MPNTNGKSNVLIVSDNQALVEDLSSALKDEKDFNIQEHLNGKTEIGATIAKTQPEIVLLDFNLKGEATYELVDKLASQFPAIAVVVILPESDVHHSDKVILSGARAFILHPFTKKFDDIAAPRGGASQKELSKPHLPGSGDRRTGKAQEHLHRLQSQRWNRMYICSGKSGCGFTPDHQGILAAAGW